MDVWCRYYLPWRYFIHYCRLYCKGVNSSSTNDSIEDETTETVDIAVSVTDGTDPVSGAIVTIGGKSCANGTGSGGGCTVKGVAIGEGVEISVTCEGYVDYTDTIDVTAETTSLSITLTASE